MSEALNCWCKQAQYECRECRADREFLSRSSEEKDAIVEIFLANKAGDFDKLIEIGMKFEDLTILDCPRILENV